MLDGGPCDVGIESTIVDVSGTSGTSPAKAAGLRPGGIALVDLARVLGYVPDTGKRGRDAPSAGGRVHPVPRVSGDLASHYAPQTPTRRVDASDLEREARADGRRVAVLARTIGRPAGFDGIWRQAPADPSGYARALYAELRVLDAFEVDRILVESLPDGADWHAINDRLRRATHDTEANDRAGLGRNSE